MKFIRFFLISFCLCFFFISHAKEWSPKVSIITSIYKGDVFIAGFLKDIVRQTIFKNCELILINANSPGNEEVIILEYLKKYHNIIYKRLDNDPGYTGVWNIGIKMARAQYITNANLDDRLSPYCYEAHSGELDKNPKIDLIYSDSYITKYPNETFEVNRARAVTGKLEFSAERIKSHCLPSCNPMWRKSLHDKYGLFDSNYKIIGDWEMWIRAVLKGSVFKKIKGFYGLYYQNPAGLSTSKKNDKRRAIEFKQIIKKYRLDI